MDSSSSRNTNTARWVSFEGSRLDGKTKRFEKSWDENAPFTLAYLDKTIRRKIHLDNPEISIELTLMMPGIMDAAGALRDEHDLEVFNEKMFSCAPGIAVYMLYSLIQYTAASSSSENTSSDDDSNGKVAGSSPTINQSPLGYMPKLSTFSHHPSSRPNGRSSLQAPLEGIYDASRSLLVPKRMDLAASTLATTMNVDVEKHGKNGEDEDALELIHPATQSEQNDVRPTKKAKKTKADIDEHSDVPVHPAQKPDAAGFNLSESLARSRAAAQGLKRQGRASTSSAKENKLTYKILPNGLPVKRGPGRPSPNVQYVTEKEANEILAKMDKRDKNKKRKQKKSKAGMHLLRKVILRTLQSLDTDTGVPIFDPHTLSVLTLVCKDTLKIAGPWLYANVRLDSFAQWEHIFGHKAPAALASHLGRDLVKSVDLILDSSDLQTCTATSLSLAPGQFVAPKLLYVRLDLFSPSISDLDSAHKSDLARMIHSLHALISAQLVARPDLIGGMQQDERMWTHVVCQSERIDEAEKEREMVETVMGEVWDEMGPRDRKGKAKAKEGRVDWREEQEWMWEVTAKEIETREEEEDVEMVEEEDEIDGASSEDDDEDDASDSDESDE